MISFTPSQAANATPKPKSSGERMCFRASARSDTTVRDTPSAACLLVGTLTIRTNAQGPVFSTGPTTSRTASPLTLVE